ncbi:MAG: lytic murein transglycosylase B [Steroidobacteraceae bacterium]
MTTTLLRVSLLALLTISCTAPAAEVVTGLDVARPDVQEFIASMAMQHGFDPAGITGVLRDAQTQPRILQLIQRPAERRLAWWEYRKQFVTEERIDGGVKVWQTHREELARIADRSGVPAEYLVAITGVETSYGRNTGRYRVLDALATLGFDYPPRSEFFRRELEQFLLMTREDGVDPRMPLGSYAGAMGIAQFMPSSVRAYAVDDGQDGHRDLSEYGPDVFASIANYFVMHGWSAGQPVLAEINHGNPPDDPAAAKLALEDTLATLHARGYIFSSTMPEDTPAMLVPAALEQGMSWRVGYQNFYVITRYNRSTLYAMAVHELAQAIAQRYHAAAVPVPVPVPGT